MRAATQYRVHIACAFAAALLLTWWFFAGEPAESPMTPPQNKEVELSPAAPIASSGPAQVQLAPTSMPASTGALRGRVIDAATKLPVQEFRLELQRTSASNSAQSPHQKSFRNSNGRFEWLGLPMERWRLVVSAADYQTFQLEDLRVEADRSTPDLLIPLRRGATLAGRVYDQSTGKGIAKARITFREAHVARFAADSRNGRVLMTDARGLFKLEGLPKGRVTLLVSSTHYADREMDVVTNESTTVDIALSAGATIAGLLTASDGATAIAGTVGLIELEQESGITINTEPNGEFAFRKLPPGRYRLIGRTERGRAQQEFQIVGDERLEGIVLAIQSGGTIRGLIRGLRAQDLSRLNITVQRPNAGLTLASNPSIDERGAYVLNGVEAGHMAVIAELAMRRRLTKLIDMPPDGNLVVDFDFPPGARLSGRVTRDGAPVANTQLLPQAADARDPGVVLYPATTNERGEYVIDELGSGEYVLNIGTYRSPVVRVLGDTNFDIDVPSVAHFAGRVLESDSEVPIVGASVDVWAADPKTSFIRMRGTSNHLGEFSLSGLEPSDLIVTVYKPGYEMHREQFTYGSPITDRSIRLRMSRGVNVRVTDSRTGKALRGVQATEIYKGAAGINFLLQPDENGEAQLPASLAGSGIRFSASGFISIVVPTWNGQSLQVNLPPVTSGLTRSRPDR